MEEFSNINFLAVIEGQEYEHSLQKIVNTNFLLYLFSIITMTVYNVCKNVIYHAKPIPSQFSRASPSFTSCP